jgi:hypothetical protein
MPVSTVPDIPQDEQAQMLAALRRARYGYLPALHALLLDAAGRTPRRSPLAPSAPTPVCTVPCAPIAPAPLV